MDFAVCGLWSVINFRTGLFVIHLPMRIRNLTADDIVDDVCDAPLLRELRAATGFRILIDMFDGSLPLAFAVALSQRGNDRIISPSDYEFLMTLFSTLPLDDAWVYALTHRFFRHMDRPILCEPAFDFNALSECDCRSRFHFDHAGIRERRTASLAAVSLLIFFTVRQEALSAS